MNLMTQLFIQSAMKPNSLPPSSQLPSHQVRARVRVRVFPIKPSPIHQSPFTLLTVFFIVVALSIPTTTAIPSNFRQIPYAKFCNDVVPEPTPTGKRLKDDVRLQLQNAYFAGGDQIVAGNYPKTLSLRTGAAYETETRGVLGVEGAVAFWDSKFMGFSGDSTRRNLKNINYPGLGMPRIPVGRRPKMGFRIHGFWSKDSGKLCMVGSGNSYLSSYSVVLKLNYRNASMLDTSLVNGTLESLDTGVGSKHFDLVSILGLAMVNYQYKLVDRENENGGFSEFDRMENVSLGLDVGPTTVCSAFRSASRFELEYIEDCDSVNCNPLGVGVGILPGYMSFNQIDCPGNGKVRYTVDFSNTSYIGRHLPFGPNTMLVAEGAWNGKKKHLDLVACRIFNSTDSVAKASLGDCSIRLSLRFPATLSLRHRSPIVGQIWSNKSRNDSGYFGRVVFQSLRNGHTRVEGGTYEYTEIDSVTKSCAKKMTGRHRKGTYPNGYSFDMRFDMTVRNSKGQGAWGYSSPLSVGDRFYERHSMFPLVNNSQAGLLNISYVLSFSPPSDFKLGGEALSTRSVEISAEGTYNTKTGVLCMIGCRHLELQNKRSAKNESLDCEILISMQYPPLNAKDGSYVKGTIESNRIKSDPLYFERLELFANSISMTQANESIWRLDLEITMVLISNTLACIFVGLQLFHVKKYPDVLPFISVVMLTVLTLAHLIPLVLNFEALFLADRNRQNVFLGSGGWLEVNEVLVRVITMIAFLLQFRLLQQTWSARIGDGSWKSLWVSDKKVLFLSLPLYIGGGLIAWFVHQWKYSHMSPVLRLRRFGYKKQSFWGAFKSFAGLVLDGFLLPQIVFNVFSNSGEMALAPSFYIGTTVVRLLPHAYDLYRAAHGSTLYFGGIYANPRMDYYSTAWDIVISCGGLLFIILIYLQQHFGGRCFLPKRFRESNVYEKVPVVASSELVTRQVIS